MHTLTKRPWRKKRSQITFRFFLLSIEFVLFPSYMYVYLFIFFSPLHSFPLCLHTNWKIRDNQPFSRHNGWTNVGVLLHTGWKYTYVQMHCVCFPSWPKMMKPEKNIHTLNTCEKLWSRAPITQKRRAHKHTFRDTSKIVERMEKST